jgi:polyphosphate kinase 2 (PPK2 family)
MMPIGYSLSSNDIGWEAEMSATKKKASKVDNAEKTDAQNAKLKSKDYERELANLHIELVKLRQHKGLHRF